MNIIEVSDFPEARVHAVHPPCIRSLPIHPTLIFIFVPRSPVLPAKRKHSLQRDFQDGQYYITGKLTTSVFDDDCAFIDPTTNVSGPEKYCKAVAILFDPATSRADLISIQASLF